MSWLARLLPARGEAVPLDAAVRDALARWQALPPPDLGIAHFEARYVVVNTEATGLDHERDTLLAVAAVAVDCGLLSPLSAYHAPLDPDPAAALAGLVEFAAAGPVVVFNAGFNRSLLQRALDAHLGLEPRWLWLDLQWLLPALYSERIDEPVRLGEWMKAFGIAASPQPHAVGDAWAIGQLMLAAQSRALALGLNTPRSLAELERSRRQLRPPA